ncbi:MAG TPA: Xaa-Pro peptidase family protein [Candidatus Acidoferrum sp.]|nr:Xaa-Pro peptidase family protein [Candidatus Acidoferrum sp.]
MNETFAKRRREVTRELKRRQLDCLLVTHPANWYYLTGFTGDSGILVITPGGSTLITDGRFTTQAKQESPSVQLELQKGGLYVSLADWLAQKGIRRAGYDPEQWTLAQWKTLRKASGAKCRAIEARGVVESLRMKKDAQELAAMRKAAILAGEVLQGAVKLLRPGVTEIEIAAEIEFQMKKRGASGPAFETIVAFGARGALPHARPTAKRLRKNELVVLDLGVILGHYCSDITRSVYVGRATRRIRQWYRAVQDANQAAIAAVGSGVSCGEVDAAARNVLNKNGLERHFVHSTGHGLGLEVHEAPRVARGQSIRLEAGNVITIEPGVYIEGVGGIRIEDDVAVGFRGSEVLTRVTRDLIEL